MATEHLIDPSTLDAEALTVRGELFCGVVTAVLDGDVAVTHEGRATLARRAASCLLSPLAGDVVLVARTSAGTYVLAVLDRDSSERAIEVDGDLALRSRRGAVTVEAERELRLRTRGSLGAAAKTLTLAAEQASWVAASVRVLSEHLTLESSRIKQVASFAEVVVDSVKETLGRSSRTIRESEHVDAGSMTLSVRNLLRSHADTAIATARKLIKLDGDQIHLG